MLPFSLLSHTFNNLKCYTRRFLCKHFCFTYYRSQHFFFGDKFPLQEIFLGIVTPPPVICHGPSLTEQVKWLKKRWPATIFKPNEMSHENWRENKGNTEMKTEILTSFLTNNVRSQTEKKVESYHGCVIDIVFRRHPVCSKKRCQSLRIDFFRESKLSVNCLL